MNRVIAGLVFLALSMWAAASWWWFLWDVIKGLAAVGLFVVGLTLIGLGVRNMTGAVPESTEGLKEKE